MKNTPLSFPPPDFSLGQVGQLGQIAESLANSESCVFILHIFSGTALGQGGTTQFQNVSGRKKRRAKYLSPAPLSSARKENEHGRCLTVSGNREGARGR
ncbi:hypothetical protein ACLIIZ_17975 [Azonexus caeni]|jgi:hypothetical protein|uniref:hypothetical protein n=1 Tax=Azonexus caeni TaxID=266126 RepID=UPI003A88FB6C